MLPVLSRHESRQFDENAVGRLGVSGALLMENAGRGATDAVVARFPSKLTRPLVVGGLGQNGGDAWVVARHLLIRGHAPHCVLFGSPSTMGGDARPNFEALVSLGVEVTVVSNDGTNFELFCDALARASIVIEGLFGTGLDRDLVGLHAEVVDRLNRSCADVVSLDVPSGVDADCGAVRGVAIEAVLTTTFVAPKRGLLQYPGRQLAGEVVVCDIGVPGPVESNCEQVTDTAVARLLPGRAADMHKGSVGRVMVIAGGPGTLGAALLAGGGALRAGAGLVTVCSRAGVRDRLAGRVLEMMTATPSQENGAAYLQLANEARGAVVGPGFGLDAQGREIMLTLATSLRVPAVLDADALTAVADEGLGLLTSALGPRVLTPHPGEAARLLGVSAAEVQADRFGAAQQLASQTGQVVVLKGAGSVVASVGSPLRVTTAGCAAMAGAGMGDVLAGVIGALVCSLPARDAATVGIHVHGRAGQLASRGDRGLLASDLCEALPPVMASSAGR